MTDPVAHLPAVRSSTADLIKGVEAEQWSEDDVHAPSLLPGWTRAHVLTHLARNADGISATLGGALRGEIVARYPEGPEGRNRDVETGASRHVAELLADLRESADRLDRMFAAVAHADGWQLTTESGRPASTWVAARWREVEIHRVDLAGGYRAGDWPPAFVALELPHLVDGLAERAGRALHLEATAEGSVSPDLAGRSWDVGDGEPLTVRGPDWALFAWALGRPTAAGDALTAMPELSAWR
jgi:maleylpyruvate isomerase